MAKKAAMGNGIVIRNGQRVILCGNEEVPIRLINSKGQEVKETAESHASKQQDSAE